MKSFNLYDPTYEVECAVFINCSLSELARRTGMKDVSDEDAKNGEISLGRCIAYTSENKSTKEKKTKYIVWLKENDPQVLAHELTHLCIQVFTDKKIPINLETTEQAARYVDQWFGTIYPKIAKGAKLRLPTSIKNPVTFSQIWAAFYTGFAIAGVIFDKNPGFIVGAVFAILYWKWLEKMYNRRFSK